MVRFTMVLARAVLRDGDGSGPGGALTGINPADITRIEVLEDIGSISAYGLRGANGAVLISTRRN